MIARTGEEGLLLLRIAKRQGVICPLTSEPRRRSPSVCTRNPSALAEATGGCAHLRCQIPNLKINGAPRVGCHLWKGQHTHPGHGENRHPLRSSAGEGQEAAENGGAGNWW